jgi:hypothetical protein
MRTLKDRFAAIFSMCIAMSAFGAKKEAQLPDRLSLYSEFRSISFVRQLCQMKMLELFFRQF